MTNRGARFMGRAPPHFFGSGASPFYGAFYGTGASPWTEIGGLFSCAFYPEIFLVFECFLAPQFWLKCQRDWPTSVYLRFFFNKETITSIRIHCKFDHCSTNFLTTCPHHLFILKMLCIPIFRYIFNYDSAVYTHALIMGALNLGPRSYALRPRKA